MRKAVENKCHLQQSNIVFSYSFLFEDLTSLLNDVQMHFVRLSVLERA